MDENKIVQAQFVLGVGLLVVCEIFDLELTRRIILGILMVMILVPPIGKEVGKLWLKFAQVLGVINGTILLSIVYFTVVVPMSIIYRLVSSSSMQIKKQATPDSNYSNRSVVYGPSDLKKTW